MTTRSEIGEWFDFGRDMNMAYMIVATDTFSYEDFPHYVGLDEDVRTEIAQLDNANMTKVMEVYNLNAPKDYQLFLPRAWSIE